MKFGNVNSFSKLFLGTATMLALSSCASWRHASTPPPAPAPTPAPTPAAAKQIAPTASAMALAAGSALPSPQGTSEGEKTSPSDTKMILHPVVPEAGKKALPGNEPGKAVPVSRAVKKASVAPEKNALSENPITAEKSLGWLKNGNHRFVKGYFRNDGATAKDRARLAEEQHPHAVIVACSDSRVPPEVIFDQKLGEIIVVRTAGEAMDDVALGSVESAVQHLGTHLIVVLGHESCGAVTATLNSLNGSDAGSPAMDTLVAMIRPHVQGFAGKPVSEGALVESWANVSGVAKDLVLRSQILRDAVNAGEVKIQTAVYHLGSGEVEFR